MFKRLTNKSIRVGPFPAPARTINLGDGTVVNLPVGDTVDHEYSRLGTKAIQVSAVGAPLVINKVATIPVAERSAIPGLLNQLGTSSGSPTSSVSSASTVDVDGSQYLFYQRSFLNSVNGGKVTLDGLTATAAEGNYVLGSAKSFQASSVSLSQSSLLIVGVLESTGAIIATSDFSEASLVSILPLALVSTGTSSVLLSVDINADLRVIAYRVEDPNNKGSFLPNEGWLNVGEDPKVELLSGGNINLSYYSDGTRRGRKLAISERSQWAFLGRYNKNASSISYGELGDGTWFGVRDFAPVISGAPAFVYSGVLTASFSWIGIYNPSTKVVDNYIFIAKEPNQYSSLGNSRIDGFSLSGTDYVTTGKDIVKVGDIADSNIIYSGYFASSIAKFLDTTFSGGQALLQGLVAPTKGNTQISDGVMFDVPNPSMPGTSTANKIEYKAEYTAVSDDVLATVFKDVLSSPTLVATKIEYKAEYSSAEDSVTFDLKNGVTYTAITPAATIT